MGTTILCHRCCCCCQAAAALALFAFPMRAIIAWVFAGRKAACLPPLQLPLSTAPGCSSVMRYSAEVRATLYRTVLSRLWLDPWENDQL